MFESEKKKKKKLEKPPIAKEKTGAYNSIEGSGTVGGERKEKSTLLFGRG